MRRYLFLRIVDALGNHHEYFQTRFNAAGRMGFSPLQKCIVALRVWAYKSPADSVVDYVQIGETTMVECLEIFVRGVKEIFGIDYLRRPKTILNFFCFICSFVCWESIHFQHFEFFYFSIFFNVRYFIRQFNLFNFIVFIAIGYIHTYYFLNCIQWHSKPTTNEGGTWLSKYVGFSWLYALRMEKLSCSLERSIYLRWSW